MSRLGWFAFDVALSALLLSGCDRSPPPKAACYRLETCEFGMGSPTGLCVVGVSRDGSRTGEVHRFLTRDMLEAWSQLHPGAHACE